MLTTRRKIARALAEKMEATEARSGILTAPAKTEVLQKCHLDLYADTQPCYSYSGIMCTIGPVSKDVRTLEKMMEAGMSLCRLNISHGTYKEHEEVIANIRQAEMKLSKLLGYSYPVAIALDTRGPEIRTGTLQGGPKSTIFLKDGEQLKLSSDRAYTDKGNTSIVFIDFDISKIVKPGGHIFIDHGKIVLGVSSTGPANAVTDIQVGGELAANKCVTLEDVVPDMPQVSDRDKQDLKFAVTHDLEIILASHVTSADMINQIREVLGPEGRDIIVIAKLQTKEALRNIKSISEAADGVMFCRDDLSLELSPTQMFKAQKYITAFCHKKKKPILYSADVLVSMAKVPMPTLNDITELTVGFIDGIDCIVMTSLNTYYVEKVVAVKKIITECDRIMWQRRLFEDLKAQIPVPMTPDEATALMAVEESVLCLAAAIIVMTTSGRSAHLVSKYKPRCPLIVVSTRPKVARQCNLYRGIVSLQYTGQPMSHWDEEIDARILYALQIAKEEGFVTGGDPIIVVSGWKHGPSYANCVRTMYVFRGEREDSLLQLQ